MKKERKVLENPENQELVSYCLKLLGQKGLIGEVYLAEQKQNSLEVRYGKLIACEVKTIKGLGVRVLQNKTMGLASTTDLSKKGILAAIEKAVASSDYLTPEEYSEFAAGFETLPAIQTYDSSIEAIPLTEKIKLAKGIEEAALAFDPRVKRILRSVYSDKTTQIYLANTLGLKREALSGLVICSIDLTAEESGETENVWGSAFARNLSGLKPMWLGRAMAEKAVQMLGAKKYLTQKTNIILDPEMTLSLLFKLAPAFNAKSVLEGKSLFAGKIGEKIASVKVSLIDDGILEAGPASFPFDGEGMPRQRTVLIERGILKGFLHQIKTARQMQVKPTGNAVRSYSLQPVIAPTNLYLEPGDISQKDLISQISNGILVNRLMNLHSINAVSGDFSLGASGRLIENGQLSYPVRGFTIAGNLADFLKKIALVANDFQLFLDEDPFSGVTGGGASILVEDVSVAGE